VEVIEAGPDMAPFVVHCDEGDHAHQTRTETSPAPLAVIGPSIPKVVARWTRRWVSIGSEGRW
jgi:hypothetical protein